jgi:hypothetical protein
VYPILTWLAQTVGVPREAQALIHKRRQFYPYERVPLALNIRKGLSRIHWKHTIGGIAWLPTEGAGVGFIDTKK